MAMSILAGDEPAISRREYWQHVASAALGALDLRVVGDITATDRIVAGQLGAVRVGAVSSRWPGGAVRTARHVRRSASDLCKIDIPVDGSGVVAQDGREAVLRPGDFALVDLSRPARWAMSTRRVIAVVFPRTLLPLPSDQLRQVTAVAVGGDRGGAALVSSVAAQLVQRMGEYEPAEAVRLGTVAVDLLACALSPLVDVDITADVRARALAVRVEAFIDEHLADPRLSPGVVAAANHLSVRALHRMFEQRHTSVSGWIRQRRLERCRRDLLDPTLRDRPVSATGARWGWTNAAHFSRVFRDAYGLPPAEYRQRFVGRVSPGPAPPGPG
ncbi:helix-turn-helix domain-containing protein [Pseudonocardia humida]|uniref:Helix-turn-helix domain-containing protein n=1 Tax=Pseudonocardia humida TaxID=2800819 RepID=A0ABT1ADB5_9PSEU|nr:helix-turn-helix domain-containing protein [Pseudonocardia humida]MCO1660918.1 helix-turn-helix domain-containing protein [Pseudonocardia humida]